MKNNNTTEYNPSASGSTEGFPASKTLQKSSKYGSGRLNLLDKKKGNGDGSSNSKGKQSVPFYKLFASADAVDIMLMMAGTAGAMINGMDYPVMTILFGSLIDAFGKNSLQHQNSVVDHVFTAAFRFVYLGIAIGVGSFFQISCWMCAGERQAVRIRRLYLETILRQDIEYFDTETSTGEILGIMSGDTKLIQEAIGEKVGTFIQLTTTFTGGLIVAFVRGWKLTLVLLAAVPLLIAVGAAMVLVITKASSQGQKAYTEASVVVEQKISSIKTVASFCGEKKAINDYDRSLKPAYKAALYQGLANGFGMGSYMFIIYCTYAMALWYGSKLIINEGYSGGKVVNVIFAILSGGISLGQASPALNAFAEGQAAAYKMFETFNRKPEIDANTDGMVLQDIHGDVELKDVHFRYPSRPEVQIFCGISLFIPRGTTAAIVGESGSGKSTIVSLIERFYDPQFGEVLVDGFNIKQFKLKWIRGKIGLVSQEPVLFATSIRENIAYGKEGATLSEIESAAELANASKFISKMPQGFETMVGEHGAHLSGGQKQRIAIARAILKNPRILLLDEATSALDAESEKLVQEALDRVMMNRTTVIVAHRLSTVRAADMITVVQGGSIVEKGTHSELMKNPHGAYSQLVSLQEMNGSKDQVELDDQHDTEITHDDTSNRISVGSRSFKWPSLPKWSRSPRIIGKCSVAGLAKKVDISEENKNHNIFFSFSWFKVKRDIEQGKSNGDKDVPISRLAVLNKPEVPVLAVGSLAAALAGLSYPLFGLFFSNIISSLFESPHELRREISHWAVMLVGLAVSMLLMSPIQSYAFAIAGGKLVQRVQSMVFKKVIYQDMAWFDSNENSSGAIVSRLSTDPGNVRAVVGDALSLTVQNTATILSGLIIAFTASWKLSLLLIALLPLLGLHSWVQVKILKGFSADAKVKYEQASQVANEALGSIRTVASFCAEEKVLRLYNEKSDAPLKNGTRKGIVSGLGLGFSNFVMFASYALIFWVGSLLVKSGDATFGDVFKVFFAVALAALGVSESMGMSPDIGKVKNSVNSIFSILDTKSKIDASDDSGSILEDLRGNIEFNHVTFSYPSRRDAQIFRDFCAFFPSGKTVALVGESGSGKSTVIALCQRFYDPDSGTILLDGVEVPKLQVKWLRQQIGVVSQEPVLFNDTILANIAYGKDGLVSEEQITAAAEASNAHKFISTLPQGYQTLVGERGMQLSGGQKQRIAIARAIIKEPKILLLDEATSALDAESERLVQDALDHVKINRTTIVVAHRLSTIKDADKIIVLKNGVIAEEGKHDELLSLQGGAYSTLFRLYMGSS